MQERYFLSECLTVIGLAFALEIGIFISRIVEYTYS